MCLENDMSSIRLNGIKEMDHNVLNELGYFYSHSECNISQCLQRAKMHCFAFCGRCDVRWRTSKLILSDVNSLNTSCRVCRGDKQIVQCMNKVHCIFDLELASEANLNTFWEV